MSDIDMLKKVKLIRFRQFSNEFDKTKFLSIIFQRVGKFKYFKIIAGLKSEVTNKGGENDNYDIIEIERKDSFKPGELNAFLGTGDVESGIGIDLDSLNEVKEITDKEFRDACIKGSKISYGLTRGFLFMEIVSKFADVFLLFVLPLYGLLELSKESIIIFLVIFIPIIMSQVICDWSKLSEKYSKLCYDFAKLANSKDEKRIDLYQNLVITYRGSLIHSDIVAELN